MKTTSESDVKKYIAHKSGLLLLFVLVSLFLDPSIIFYRPPIAPLP